MRDVKSRSQRRMEKRQALVLLALVLVVSLVSFTLGMMVGRGVAPKPVAQEAPAAAVRMPVTAPPSAPPAAEPAATGEEAGKVNLTFYDTLPKGEEPPLGSGINLPPREGGLPAGQPAAEEQKGSPPPAKVEARPKATPPTEPAAKAPAPPKTASTPAATSGGEGSYVVQVASFRSAEDALALQGRLAKKGYRAYLQDVDLGSKGVWTRVYIGFYPSAEAAQPVAKRLQEEEKLSPMVRKR